MATGQINPKEYSLIFGIHQIQGFHEGTIINIVYEANNYNPLIGADGEVSRILTNNQSALITVTLAQTSLSNDFLSVQSNLDRKSGTGALPLLFKDNWGKSAGVSPVAWIEKMPDQPFDGGAGATVQSRVWNIRAPLYEGIVGSSKSIAVS